MVSLTLCLVSWFRGEPSSVVWRQSRAGQASKVAAPGPRPAAAPGLVTLTALLLATRNALNSPDTPLLTQRRPATPFTERQKYNLGLQHPDVVRLNKGKSQKNKNRKKTLKVRKRTSVYGNVLKKAYQLEQWFCPLRTISKGNKGTCGFWEVFTGCWDIC